MISNTYQIPIRLWRSIFFIENNILNKKNRSLRGAVTKIYQPTVNKQDCFGRGDLSRLNQRELKQKEPILRAKVKIFFKSENF